MTLQPELQPCPGGSEKSSEAPAPAESAGPMDVDQPVARHHRPDLKEQNAPPIPSEYFSPVRITRSSGIIGGSVGSSTVPPESVSSTHGVKRKRSGTNPSVSSQPDVDADEDWAQARESLRAVPPKKSRQKGGKQPVSFPVSKPKGLGPKQGVITLQEGEMLMGGTLGETICPHIYNGFREFNDLGQCGQKWVRSSARISSNYSLLNRFISLVGCGCMGRRYEGRADECPPEQSKHGEK